MATLLRRLGVPVDGGAFPTDQQVTASYKKALLRFHPDRAAALAKSDPASQVEAEEKFKLVSKMKSKAYSPELTQKLAFMSSLCRMEKIGQCTSSLAIAVVPWVREAKLTANTLTIRVCERCSSLWGCKLAMVHFLNGAMSSFF
ncbi:hypothetical protein GOP47_0021068 [Adiantum capillus-veneris]|uniref:J domain-containing protein n=1 Tax=Adiantum capillus-veneris TaxID=13818 RepID=A0A9D4UBC5_ADICA|nr:hypothetical protein GOP47_0021068 [Adiantum capillus-veneris]